MIASMDRRGSAFIVDMDGAMVKSLGPGLEAAGHKVVKLDPDNIASASAAIEANDTSQTQPTFANTARVFIKGLLLYVWLYESDKTLMRLRSLLCRGLPEKVRGKEDPF